MKVRIIIWAFIFWGGFVFFGFPAYTDEKRLQPITCKDGETFMIERSREVHTAHPETLKENLIVVDVQKLRLNFYQNGRLMHSYPVAIGDYETPSPIGEWKVIHKGGKWGNGFGERWIGLDVPWGIYGIHGTNKPSSIGTRSSHGCIRMFNHHVLELYNLAKLGTPVHIIGKLPPVIPRKELRRNSTGRDVVAFQLALRKAGFETGRIDGRFGADMEKAVYRLQYLYGLSLTGQLSLNEQAILGFR